MFFAKFPYVNYDHLAGVSTGEVSHGSSSSALAISGKDFTEGEGVFWPCYRTAREAIAASPRPDLIREGESTQGYHVVTIQGVDFYMSNGLIEGTNQLHAASAVTYNELVDQPEEPSENGAKLATNIMRRFRFRRSVVSNKVFFYRIDISDTDRPDILAHKFYGDPQLHWVILMANDIRDPYNDWPRTQHSLEKKVAKVYPGSSLFLYTTSLQASGWEYQVDDDTAIIPDGTSIPSSRAFSKGDVVESHLTGKRASVHSWDPTYSRLVLVGPESHLFPANEYVHNISTGRTRVGFGVKFVADSSQAIHHWEDNDGVVINPMELDRSTGDQNNPLGTATMFYRDSYILGATSITLDDLLIPKQLRVVTNEQHEVAENDKKRRIKIIRPEYVPALKAELKSVFEQ